MRRFSAPLAALLTLLPLWTEVVRAAPTPAGPTPNSDLYGKSLEAAAEAVRTYGTWDNPEQQRRVASIGYRIAQESGFRDFPLSFFLVDMAEPNAFALPGGQVFVTRGILALGLTDDELAGLLGHEIAHVVYRHGVRMERRATLLNVLSQAAVIGVMINASRQQPRQGQYPYPYGVGTYGNNQGDMVTGTYAASLILSELLLRSYSRDFEDEADEAGQRWAAAAGFRVDGTERLMEVLGSRLPDSKDYGYWRTHPFFEQRVAAAKVRGQGLKQGEERSDEEFRSWSQRKILDYGAEVAKKPPTERLVESSALNAWPKGAEAERLRLERIHRERDSALEALPLSRDYGVLLASYQHEIDDVRTLDPGSSLVATLQSERDRLAAENAALLPQAIAVWNEGIYQTGFLEKFISNWPEADQIPAVALALGNAYSRTGREADAVTMYLRAAKHPGTAIADEAHAGLRALAPNLNQLTALAELAHQDQDPELAAAAARRLDQVAGSYEDISLGAAYLTRFPEGEHVTEVARRRDALADNLYGEILLYQGIGDQLKAVDRIQKILTYAPTSPAAQKLLDKVVLPG